MIMALEVGFKILIIDVLKVNAMQMIYFFNKFLGFLKLDLAGLTLDLALLVFKF
jgi:hypothetical protein